MKLMGFVKLVGTAHSNCCCLPGGTEADVCGNSWGEYTVGSFRSTGLWHLRNIDKLEKVAFESNLSCGNGDPSTPFPMKHLLCHMHVPSQVLNEKIAYLLVLIEARHTETMGGCSHNTHHDSTILDPVRSQAVIPMTWLVMPTLLKS